MFQQIFQSWGDGQFNWHRKSEYPADCNARSHTITPINSKFKVIVV